MSRPKPEPTSAPASSEHGGREEALRLSVVIPVYNEIFTIREVLRRVFSRPEVSEVVAVDDGSTDGSREALKELEKRYGSRGLRVLFKERNEGKGSALALGFKEATGDIVLVQDADLEYDPDDYPRLVAPIREGKADVVYGSRFLSGDKRVLFFWHTLANRLLTLACNMASNLNLTDVWTCYKVFRRDLIAKLPLRSKGFNFEPEVTIKLAKLGCRIYEVPVSYAGRTYAEGKKIGLKDAFIGLWTTFRTALGSDLGELAVGEQTLRIMARAGRYNRFIYGLVRPYLGAKVAEIGSGVGNFSRFLLDREEVLLTDLDPSYVRWLKTSYRGWEYVKVRALDLESSAPEELRGRYDSAVCFNVLEHVEDDRKGLKTIRGLLKPGGRLLLLVPAHARLYGRMDEALGHHRRYEKEPLVSLLEEGGFEVEDCFHFNQVAVPGWFLNGRLFGVRVVPNFQLSVFDRLTWLVRFLHRWRLSFGLSLLAVARRKGE